MCFDDSNSVSMEKVEKEEYYQMITEINGQDSYPYDCVELAEVSRTGVFFPNHRIIRKIPEINISNESSDCTKIYKKKGVLGAGVLLFFCVDHNNCIGFVILDRAESPKVISDIFLTRFEIMPHTILYDNSCNLSEFILNRTPQLFKDTQFLIDGFHFSAHSNCANSYNISDYPFSISVNSSLVEQKNAQLRYMKATSPCLKYNTFVMKLIYAVINMNRLTSKEN